MAIVNLFWLPACSPDPPEELIFEALQFDGSDNDVFRLEKLWDSTDEWDREGCPHLWGQTSDGARQCTRCGVGYRP